MLSRLVLPN